MANAPEGTVIQMPDGSQRVKRGGQWLPAGNMYVGAGPKLTPQENKQLGEVRMTANKASGAIQDMDRFMTLNQRQPSGQLLGLPVVRDIAGVFNDDIGEMNAINNRLTPSQRESGSGAMSDRDVDMYRRSVVGVGQTGPANQRIAALAKAGAVRQRDYAAFMDYFSRVNGTLNGAQELWDAYRDAEPVYDPDTATMRQAKSWRAYFGVGGDPAPKKSAPSAGGAGASVRIGGSTYQVREKR